MNVQQKIEKWCRNERFVRYANERISEELVYAPFLNFLLYIHLLDI